MQNVFRIFKEVELKWTNNKRLIIIKNLIMNYQFYKSTYEVLSEKKQDDINT